MENSLAELEENTEKGLLVQLEHSICCCEEDYSEARKIFRKWLAQLLGINETKKSLADLLNLLNNSDINLHSVAIRLFRCIAIDGFLPAPDATNQIERIVVEICEKGAPNLYRFLKIPTKAQTFEKYSQLKQAHSKICSTISPLIASYGDLYALSSSQKDVLGKIQSSFVREYCNPFNLQELKSSVELLFTNLNKLSSLENSFLHDYEQCQRTIDEVVRIIDNNHSFLTLDYFKVFIENTKTLLEEFLISVREDYTANIERNWSDQNYLPKKYPLHQVGQKFILSLPLKNTGAGFAESLVSQAILTTTNIVISTMSIEMGNIATGEFSVLFDAEIIKPVEGFDGILEVSWNEIGNPERKTAEFEFIGLSQNKDVNWSQLQYTSPYSDEIAEGKKFIGRENLVRSLSSRIMRSSMESFYITGQKRVGKTSLIKAATKFAEQNDPKYIVNTHYILWGDVAHSSPATSLKNLGESIEGFIENLIQNPVVNSKGDYSGSLIPLIKISDLALKLQPNNKFVIIIDEFDEIHQELFLQGNIADTFFANLRSLSRRINMCIVLVGGENMPYVMARQGQKLNNFARTNLSYFSRSDEWFDFQQMISKPTDGDLVWHENAISEIYNISNGNPYFANIVCKGAFLKSVDDRDTDITSVEVRNAIDAQISELGSNSFAHLWQDGIPRPTIEREPYILQRTRTLVAIARVLRNKKAITITNLNDLKTSVKLTVEGLHSVLNDFVARNIMVQSGDEYSFVLPIFQKWLVDVGVQQIIADTLGEELAEEVIVAENASIIKSDEIVALASSWPTYRGQKIGVDNIRAWFEQVDSPIEQRILFNILQRTKVLSEIEVREKLRTAHEMLRSSLPVITIRSKSDRRNDLLIVYTDGEGKSGSYYASMYCDENRISSNSILSSKTFKDGFISRTKEFGKISAVVIIDDLAATGKSLSDNISEFMDDNLDLLADTIVRVTTLLATQEANDRLLRNLRKIEHFDIDYRTCEILSNQNTALFTGESGFPNINELERAKALLTDLGAKIDKRRTLGFGALGLLVVFPTNTPNNTLPIIRSFSRSTRTSEKWEPLFERITHM